MKLLKSKKGFTLIELLVVIGILAVLAAIAIPSVAGLIDRANASADKTNANEMTNAIERFASEYEIVRQDLMSGLIKDVNNLDGAQGRVYYVTKVTTQIQIENLEKDATAGPETTGRAIYRDTKYPVNVETTKAIVEAYTKTSSATFVPKQSDKHYYYSPDCGLVVVGDKNVTDPTKLNELVVSGMDAKGNELGVNTKWINLTTATYTDTDIQVAGSATLNGSTLSWDDLQLTENGTLYGYKAEKITDTSIGELAFMWNETLDAIVLPNTITDIEASAFLGCTKLESIVVPDGITTINASVFSTCPSLANVVLPNSITKIDTGAFYGCSSLTSIALPGNVTRIGSESFADCTSLTNISFNGTKAQWNNIEKIRYWNYGCQEITVTCTDGTVIIPAA